MFNNMIRFEREVRKIYQITSGSQLRSNFCMSSGCAGDSECSIQWMPAGFRNMIV